MRCGLVSAYLKQRFRPQWEKTDSITFCSSEREAKRTITDFIDTVSNEVCLCKCETWSPTIRENRRVRVFENSVLWTIFGSKRDDVTGKWRRLHKEELYVLYSSPNTTRVIKSRRLRQAGHVARMRERRGAYRVFAGKRKGRTPLGRSGRRWEDNIKMDLREVGWGHGVHRCGSGEAGDGLL